MYVILKQTHAQAALSMTKPVPNPVRAAMYRQQPQQQQQQQHDDDADQEEFFMA